MEAAVEVEQGLTPLRPSSANSHSCRTRLRFRAASLSNMASQQSANAVRARKQLAPDLPMLHRWCSTLMLSRIEGLTLNTRIGTP